VLIVNADDYGAGESATDSILDAFEERVITSASAMVWMRESTEAAQLARECGLPLGLHLNLTLPFRDADAPELARELQEELAAEFNAASRHQHRASRRRQDQRLRQAVADQLDAFRATYGDPTHIDGHHHIHVHPAVLASLPRELPVRPILRKPEDLGRRRSRRERKLRKLFRTADACVDFRRVHPMFGGFGLPAIKYGRQNVLEIMVHPQVEDEKLALRTPEWRVALAAVDLGTYADLPST
jgi:predicted glycoside hydrolase/deacetylase ChbG (UPF0249 family)